MSIHTSVKQRGVYFITFTCFNWLPLIELTNGYDLVYNFFDVMKESGNDVLGFVIMPNHVHLLMQTPGNRSISSLEMESVSLVMIL